MDRKPRHKRRAERGTRRSHALVALTLLAAVAFAGTGFSSASFTSSSAAATGVVTAAADWTAPTVAVQGPGSYLKGTSTVTATAADADSGVDTVAIQYQADQGAAWTTLCSDTIAPYTCSWVTTSVVDGAYDLRAVATDKAGNSSTSATVRTTVDNNGPVVSMTDPGTPLSGTKTFAATASDSPSGVAQVVIEYSSGTTYSTLCTATTAPYSCAYDTTKLANGTYSFRATATDHAGNTRTSSVVTGRVVSNVTSSVTLTDPGTHLRGTVALNATATSTATITSVRIQRAAAGGSTWTDICTDSTAPYTCSFVTTGVTDGTYDLRAVLTDSTGKTTTSTVVAARIVDNTAARAVDVQATNGGTAGKIDAGDTIAFTYSERMSLPTLLAGWDGSATAVSIRLRDGLLVSFNANNDVLDVTGVNLGSVSLGDSFVNALGTVTIAASMTASTTTVNGVQRTVVTLRINATAGNTASGTGAMTWTPSASATDLAGNPMSTTAVTETGTADRDF